MHPSPHSTGALSAWSCLSSTYVEQVLQQCWLNGSQGLRDGYWVGILYDLLVLAVAQDSLPSVMQGLDCTGILAKRMCLPSTENIDFSSRKLFGKKHGPSVDLGDTEKDGDSSLKELNVWQGNVR